MRYDDVLVAYWSLGGSLNDFQKRRRWSYGYLGDPKERLNEFLGAVSHQVLFLRPARSRNHFLGYSLILGQGVDRETQSRCE